jgi:hypothetical protein
MIERIEGNLSFQLKHRLTVYLLVDTSENTENMLHCSEK